jgi:hypothetical protein
MRQRLDAERWKVLEARADQPEVQARIREAIRRGEIRVAPRRGGGIRITPCCGVTELLCVRESA